MTSHHPRFVTVCQQMLALGVICAALTPAVSVMSLDLVPENPGPSAAPAPGPAANMAAYERNNAVPIAVPTEVVDPKVTEYALTAPSGARVLPGALKARSRALPGGDAQVVSTPQPVTGYGAIGVTWEHGIALAEDEINVLVRTYDEAGDDTGWSDWMDVNYSDEHGPDPGSAEARHARPGTDELLVGDVDEVQVKIETEQAAPADLQLAVIDPGHAKTTRRELPAIDTGELPGAEPAGQPPRTSSDGDLDLTAASFTPKPVIYSRAQWGADERMRDKSSLHYFEVHAGFVHHTVNANNYSAREVPAIIRGIYAYHTQSLGWSDVGYNYLVDRFGRIWEGRYGGVDRPVVGAHTLGYNDDSFAMSAIGNYDIAQPSTAVIQAYGALFGWKLSLHGVDAASPRQYVTSKYFKAINGHRDAGSTACPGRYLYAKLPEIRRLAEQAQVGFGGRQLESDLAASPEPDLVVRRATDGRVFIVPIKKHGDSYTRGKPIPTGVIASGASRIMNGGDWNRDGIGDLVTRNARTGSLYLYPGLGRAKFGPMKRIATGFKKVQLLAAVGDVTGDGWPDLMGRPGAGSMRIYPGKGVKGLRPSYVAYSSVNATRQIPVGLWNGDGAPDSLFRKGSKLSVYSGNGPGGLTGAGRALPLDLKPYDWLVGISDVGLVGHPDLVTRTRSTGELWLIQATSTGFAPRVSLGTGMLKFDLVG